MSRSVIPAIKIKKLNNYNIETGLCLCLYKKRSENFWKK